MVAQQAQLDAGTIEGWLPRSCLIYVTDTRYLPLTLTSLLTASRTMPASMDAIIYLDDVPAPVRDEAMAFLRDWGVPAHLIDFEIDSLFTDTARIPLWREGISRAGFARLGLCAAPDGYETHVVLDGDTLVGGDMTELVSEGQQRSRLSGQATLEKVGSIYIVTEGCPLQGTTSTPA
jgi:hypothetical protein